MSAARLYTTELLGLAVELARYPLSDTIVGASGEARSRACGSTLSLALSLDERNRIADIGMRVHACAVGQAAAAIFARHAKGRDHSEIATAHDQLRAWLGGQGAMPAWPDLGLIEQARDYPGRHGAIMLPWEAALSALSTRADAS